MPRPKQSKPAAAVAVRAAPRRMGPPPKRPALAPVGFNTVLIFGEPFAVPLHIATCPECAGRVVGQIAADGSPDGALKVECAAGPHVEPDEGKWLQVTQRVGALLRQLKVTVRAPMPAEQNPKEAAGA